MGSFFLFCDIMRRYVFIFCLLTAVSMVGACAGPVHNREDYANQQIARAGWTQEMIDADRFHLAMFHALPVARVETVYIYIEGDGLAWLNRSTPSLNPTPSKPVALDLALKHGAGAVYLARPCQYGGADDAPCADNKWWTSGRFAPEVIDATAMAVDRIKGIYGARNVVLVGYSGGGAVAALVAARRADVAELVTVAGNLDTGAWTALHNVSPLSGSLNPADQWAALRHIPQRHFVGGADKAVPPQIAHAYAAHFPEGQRPAIIEREGYDHSCCWVDNWPGLYGYSAPPAHMR